MNAKSKFKRKPRNPKLVKSYRSLHRDYESFIAFPVLIALSHRAMTIREISRTLLISTDTVRRRVRELQATGYIVQRLDRRWVQTTSLQIAGVPQPTSVPGVGIQTPPVVGTPIEFIPAHKREEKPKPPPRPKPPKVSTLEAAARLAAHFRVPESIEGQGEIGIGAVTECGACGQSTPLKFGGKPVCSLCARVWGRADQMAAGEEVTL